MKWFILILTFVAVLNARQLKKILILDRVGIGDEMYFHKDYFSNYSIGFNRVNRMVKGIVVTCDIKKDVEFPVTGSMKLMKLLDNKNYEETAISFNYEYCKYSKFVSDKNVILLPKCPIKKGHFVESGASQFTLDGYLFGQMPLWSFKYVAELRSTNDSILLLRWAVYGHVDQV